MCILLARYHRLVVCDFILWTLLRGCFVFLSLLILMFMCSIDAYSKRISKRTIEGNEIIYNKLT